jgi:hypothetical protein
MDLSMGAKILHLLDFKFSHKIDEDAFKTEQWQQMIQNAATTVTFWEGIQKTFYRLLSIILRVGVNDHESGHNYLT